MEDRVCPDGKGSRARRATLAPPAALAHGGPLEIQALWVPRGPWGHRDLRETL